VTNLIDGWDPNMFLYLGDVYNDGTHEFITGMKRSDHYSLQRITNPTVGNHEYYHVGGGVYDAPGYFDYWNNVPHYYSFNAAGWHIISLDSTSQFNQTLPGSPQYEWLLEDLSTNSAACTMAYFHHPLFNNGSRGYHPHERYLGADGSTRRGRCTDRLITITSAGTREWAGQLDQWHRLSWYGAWHQDLFETDPDGCGIRHAAAAFGAAHRLTRGRHQFINIRECAGLGLDPCSGAGGSHAPVPTNLPSPL
jgi:hypothetical protein